MSRARVILVSLGDERTVVEEEKREWLIRVLVAMGADKKIVSQNDMNARRHIAELDLIVWRSSDGSLRVYRPVRTMIEVSDDDEGVRQEIVESGQKLIAEWLPPKIVRVREGKASNDYYRITLQEWALPFQMGG